MEINLDKDKDLQLRQFLRFLQTHVDKAKDLLEVSGIKQILFDKIQGKKAAQQIKDDQNGTGAVGNGNVAADVEETVGFVSEISYFYKDFKIGEAIEETGQKDKLFY